MDIQAYIQSGIIESYVLGLASAEEVEELERLQLQYAEVLQAISEFSVLMEQKAFENSIEPAFDIKSKIMAAIKDEESLAPVISCYIQHPCKQPSLSDIVCLDLSPNFHKHFLQYII